MTTRIVKLIQMMLIVISISNSVAVGVGENCSNLEDCTVQNSSCDAIQKQCTCSAPYVSVNDSCLLSGDFSPSCTKAGQGVTIFDERDVAGSCHSVVYVCTEKAGVSDICSGKTDLFNISCDVVLETPAENEMAVSRTDVRVCLIADLITNYGNYSVTGNISNQYGSTQLNFDIVVKNVNDKPVIEMIATTYNVNESIIVGYKIASFNVTDPDRSLQPPLDVLSVTLAYIDDSTGTIPFSVSLNDAQDQIVMDLSQSLSYAKRSAYNLRLTVNDSESLSDSILLTVNVLNVNEEPICPIRQISLEVSVRDAVGSQIANLTCSDPDLDDLIYSLNGPEHIIPFFQVKASGILTIKKQLVNVTEENTVVELIVVAADAGGLQTNVNISVTISNSVQPQCVPNIIATSKSEKTDVNTCFTLQTGCEEPVENEALMLEFISGNGTQLFRTEATGKQNNDLQVCTQVNLQNKYGTWLIVVAVNSSYGETRLTLTISVIDQNDPPFFMNTSYSTSVVENTGVGTTLFTVTAHDLDSGIFGDVRYISAGLDDSPLFVLNKTTGEISVKSAIDADKKDAKDSYTFTIMAIDGGLQQPLTAQTTITITIRDINDNPPVCRSTVGNVTVLLTLSVGQPIFNFDCSDNDRSPAFSELTYTIDAQNANVFLMKENGTIVLFQLLSQGKFRDIRIYDVTITVSDKQQPQKSISLQLTVTVNSAIPPVCFPSEISKTFRETQPQGSCLDIEVKCTDPTDPTGSKLSVQSASGSGAQLLEIRRAISDSFLGINACTNTSLRERFGTYQLVGIITNSLASTSIRWTFTVTNVNDAPMFDRAVYNVSINETLIPSTEVLKLTVTDQDDTTVNQTFHLKDVSVDLINNADYDNVLSDVFLYVGQGARTFYSTSFLNATARNLYKYNATARDNSGLSSTVIVYINILDVNSKPVCHPRSFKQIITILDPPGMMIQQLACYDTDIDPQNVYLDYEVISGDPDGYFNVTETGAVRVQKKLPRTRLYNTHTASLVISVTDRGTPSQSTTTAITITVNNAIPANCSPVVTPPNIWVIGECVIITMDCQDPTTEGTDHLVYTEPKGNYTLGFELQNSPEKGMFIFCYKNVTSADYEFKLEVDNGLSKYIKTLVIKVSYEKATPVFNLTKYEKSLTENVTVNTRVLNVLAKSQNLIGKLIYSVLDTDSFNSWDNYFSLNAETGAIVTKASIRQLADRLVNLRIEAEDTGSKLKSSTQVEISVIDINEMPNCVFSTESLSIDVDVEPGTKIAEFVCNDTDTKSEYRQLNYLITGDTDYFTLGNGSAPTSILVKQWIDVTIPSYTLLLSVMDNAEIPLSFQKTFQVDISLLPPPLLVEAIPLKYNLIRVNWRYNREAYKTVTHSYKVVLRKTDNTEISSGDLGTTLKNFNMTQLVEKTTYTVVVMAKTKYGVTNSSAIVLTTPEIPKLANFTATIKIHNIDYSPDLKGDSQIYQRTKKTVTESLEFSLKHTKGYAGIDIKSFREADSIYADFAVFVNQSGSVRETMRSLNSSVKSGWLDTLSVASGYFIAFEGDGYILIDSIQQLPDIVFNGTSTYLTCNIAKIGFPKSTTFDYWWTYYGNRITPTIQSRFNVTNIDNPSLSEYTKSVLVINPIINTYAGSYSCFASVQGRQLVREKLVTVDVVSQPLVILTPDSKTVNVGWTINVTCQLLTPQEDFKNFIWYRNGKEMELEQGESIIEIDEYQITLIISDIRNSSVFGCAGVNNAGTGVIVYSHIGVLQTVVTDEEYCQSSTDSRGAFWETAAAGTISTLLCPQSYTGTVTRICSKEGLFEDPVYSCVKDTIQSLATDVKGILDGVSPVNISYILDKLAFETTDLDLFNGDIDTIMECLQLINQIIAETEMTDEYARKEVDDLLQIVSNLIAERNTYTWKTKIQQENVGAIDILKVVEDFLNEVSKYVEMTGGIALKVLRDYVYTELCRDRTDQRADYSFPDRKGGSLLPDWVQVRDTGIFVKFPALEEFQQITLSGTFYKNITAILVKTLKRNGKSEDVSDSMDINADIVSFGVKEIVGILDPPARITFDHFDTNYSNPICVYWDYNESAFLTDGCSVVSTSDRQTVCECNRLTNFAVLMSPGKTPKVDVIALSIISAVGCGISILCLFLTVLLHLLVWRLVKSDRAVLLMNLCVALIIAYTIFLGGVDQAESENICAAISVMLHYFYLAVFFLMLAYGLEIAVSVIYVFVTRSRIRWLLPLAWVIPAVIVGISVGVTKLDGYGNEKFCWLSIDSSLLWAFIGPAVFVIIINLFIVVSLFRIMFKSSAMMTKSDKEKAKTGVSSICVLLPILGLTWVFGIFSVNENMAVFQYIFTVCNSLQGFFILLFHCIFNSQLRDALQHRHARKKSLASFENTFKTHHSTSTSTSFQTDQSNKQTNKELEIPNSSTNPFLEADRQMKEIVANNRRGNNVNDNLENNMLDVDKKGKKSTTVDLEDVKISNILRESEVMGGTVGISSILQVQTARTDNQLKGQHEQGVDNIDSTTPEIGNTSASQSNHQSLPSKPEGYEKLLQQQSSRQHYDRLKQSSKQQATRSFDDVDVEIEEIRKWEREKERKKTIEWQKERGNVLEKERQKQTDFDRKEKAPLDPMVSKTGYDAGKSHRPHLQVQRDERSVDRKMSRAMHSDEDYEESSKKRDKNKKKTSVKGRSRAYEYSYDSTYLGRSSRDASLENMNMQQYGYSPYAQLPGIGGYQTGRPTQQQVHRDQYRYPQRDQHQRGDYW